MANWGSVTSMRSFRYINPTLDAWTEYTFLDELGAAHACSGLMMVNALATDGGKRIEWSFDAGVTVHGWIDPGEDPSFDRMYEDRIWIRNAVAGQSSKLRLWAW